MAIINAENVRELVDELDALAQEAHTAAAAAAQSGEQAAAADVHAASRAAYEAAAQLVADMLESS